MKKEIKQLENRIKELESKNKPKQLNKQRLYSFLGVIGFGLLSILNLYLFECLGKECNNFIFNDLINIYPIIAEYILISLFVISIVAFIKGGYNKLKSYNESGLIWGLIFGLIVGLIVGLISGLIVGLIGVLIFGLIVGLITEFEE